MAENKHGDTTSWNAEEVRQSTEAEQHAPRKRSAPGKGLSRRAAYFLSVVVISAILAGVGWLLITDLCAFNKEPMKTVVEVTADDTVSTVADKLEDAGLIKYKWFFRLFASVANADEKIGIGTYELNTDMDYRALIMGMRSASGNLNAETVQITIPEGFTVAEIIDLLAEKGVNTKEALTEAAETTHFDVEGIDNETESIERLEGFLFPDTYDFYKPEKASTALNRLVKNFAVRMDEERMEKVKDSSWSLEEIITIASLIEKETDGTDQGKIASVIYNRLTGPGDRAGTNGRLQIDASLLYVLPGHEGPITKEELEMDSPYNLNKNAGLPPTPIANPGLAAIDAALNPETTDYYYYALGKDGKHRFFTNYQDHMNFVSSSEYIGN